MCPKTEQVSRQFGCLVVWCFLRFRRRPMAIRARHVSKNSTGLSPICCLALLPLPSSLKCDLHSGLGKAMCGLRRHCMEHGFAGVRTKKTPGEAEQMCHNRVLHVLLQWRMRGGNRASGSDFDRTGSEMVLLRIGLGGCVLVQPVLLDEPRRSNGV